MTFRMDQEVRDLRRHPRFTLAAPYTEVRVRRANATEFSLVGHAYDISRSGLRFELDDSLDPGERIEVCIHLPEYDQPIVTSGRVVRLVDPDEVGPVRMAMRFDDVIDLAPYRAA